ncbi:MAG: hypothetical protein K0B08_07435 [Bacteroidales bacterium]|nr:hypothetical protein [Bacteroidales bacterium]
MAQMKENKITAFGTAPVFLTAISTILGAILFLRFGIAVGTLGYLGVFFIIILGHLVTIPTALAISEIATNQKVEGGGEYFLISRSFGLNIGATIGVALFFSQAISVAFYVIAFTEAFQPMIHWFYDNFGIILPKRAISLTAMGILSLLILTKGANMGVKALYIIVGILFFSLAMFFVGKTGYVPEKTSMWLLFEFRNSDDFFIIFAIIFPAFTGMTAGVGLSGDLKKPGKSIPLGTITATMSGLIVYMFITWKLASSASPEDLISDQLIMSRIAWMGWLIIPMGLAASTISSAIGSVMVAPRTLQALALDSTFPSEKVNRVMAKGKRFTNEPFNAAVITCLIAFVFVAMGDVDAVAKIISMFFMVTYGTLCLISFLYHFGSDPSYRPKFKSRWYISLVGFVMSVWLMFKMNTPYAFLAIVLMIGLYNLIAYYNRDRKGLQFIFKGALFQLNRTIQVYLQQSVSIRSQQAWRPSVVCLSKDSQIRSDAFHLLNWIAYKHGFGTYIHLMEGYYSRASHQDSVQILQDLKDKFGKLSTNVYLDTLISPSYTSAIAQIIQLPGISGMENNMIMFEYERGDTASLQRIIENVQLVKAGNYDTLILESSGKPMNYKNGIHVWLRSADYDNDNMMILLSYIMTAHPDWRKGKIKIFSIVNKDDAARIKEEMFRMMETGRIPVSRTNIEVIPHDENVSSKKVINKYSATAGLTMIGFNAERLRHSGPDVFSGYDELGNILFVNASNPKDIQ